MLLSFRFANHRSFAEEQQLNLTPVYSPSDDLPDSKLSVPVVGIFGANASGKSNALHALSFMRSMVLYSDRAVEPGLNLNLAREPFLLDKKIAKSPSRYVVDLHLSGDRHTYGFTVDNDRVVEEWFYHYPLKKKRRIFERERDSFLWGDESRKDADLERVAGITAPSALFLSTIARFSRRPDDQDEPQPLHDVYRWFFRTRVRSRPGLLRRNLGAMWTELGKNRRVIVELMRAADVGIVDVSVRKEPPQEPLFDLEDMDVDVQTTAATRARRRLYFTHRGPAGDAFLDFQNESTGTQQLLDLAIDASHVLTNGGTMTVDEIDASLHPMLTAKLIGLFHNPKTNRRHSQLIFTSHDATLLGTLDTEEILGRDEIWFTEKGEDGTSSLYPLTDFKPRREGENRQRRYLNGNYGGVPDLSTFLFERALATREIVGGDGES